MRAIRQARNETLRMRIQVYLQAQAEIQNERSALTRVIITFMIDMVIVIIAWQE